MKSVCRDGTLKKPAEQDENDTFTSSLSILCHFANYALCLLVGVAGLWKVVEKSLVHVDVHGECVCCGWMQVARKGMFLVGCCSWL